MQGNGMGPIIWLAVSVLLIGVMHSPGFGATFYAALSATRIQMCGFTFVDDSGLLIAAPDVEASATDLMEHFQEAVDTWEGCLRATGRGIKPEKSFWCLLDFKWDSKTNKWKYKSKEEAPGTLTVRNPDNEE